MVTKGKKFKKIKKIAKTHPARLDFYKYSK